MTRSLLDLLAATRPDAALLAARLALALVIWPHGAQKLLGWFGGYGFSGTMSYFTQTKRIPAPLALAAIAVEFFGPIALALGILGRVAAAGVATVMVVAVVTTHLPNGFFMNWFGHQKGEGFEFHILAVALAAAILIGGSGAFSMDLLLTSRR